jgi:cold shock CspA family protein
MSSEQQNETATPASLQTALNLSTERRLGRVKWFNNKAGYGFLKVVENDGSETEDVFVHHSVIKVTDEQFRYLVQGEYIDFTISELDSSKHKFQATEVSGVNGCKLMCETRNEAYKNRTESRTGKVYENNKENKREKREPSSFPRQKQPPAASSQSEEGWTVKRSTKPKQKQI